MGIPERFLSTSRTAADRVAVVDGGQEWTFREIERTAVAISAMIGPGDEGRRIGIFLAPSGRYPAACLGVWMAGGVAVPLNSFLSPQELSAIIADAGISTLVTDGAMTDKVPDPSLTRILVDYVDYSPRETFSVPKVADDACAVVIYTSGSESAPKGVMLSHHNLLSNVEGCGKALSLDGQGILAILPLFHSFGHTAGMLFPLLTGSTAFVPAGFTPSAILRFLQDRRIGVIMTVPSIYRILLKLTASAKCPPSIPPICVAGGEPLPDAVADAFEKRFGVPLLNGYGMTETAPVVSLNTPTARKRGTVGRPLDGVAVRITEEGEVCVRGPNVMLGYLNKPEATRMIKDDDGWLMTGDVGTLDADGYLSIVDRKKDLIISSGENISPSEIEAAIARHPAVAEVAVVGMADATKGEVPRAVVVLHPGARCSADEIVAFCRDTIAPFKVPRSVEFRDALPRNAIGKVMKRELRSSRV